MAGTSFVVFELRQAEPLLQLRFFRSPPFSGANTVATLAFFVLAGFLFLNTLYLQEVRGYSPLMAGVAALPATIVIIVVAPFSGLLVGRRGARLPMAVSGFFLMCGPAVLVAVQPRSSYLLLAGSYLLIGLGMGIVNPPVTNTAVSGMPLSQAGVAAAVAGTSRQVGSVLGVAVLGSVVTSQMHGQLAARLAGSGLPAAVRSRLRALNVGAGSLDGHGLPARAVRIVGQAFTASTHAGWAVAAGMGLLVAAVAVATTGARAQAAAKRVMQAAHTGH